MADIVKIAANKQVYLTIIRDTAQDKFDVVDFVMVTTRNDISSASASTSASESASAS